MEPARKIPVFARVDVLVVGGGPAGVCAAIAAARAGARTLLVDASGSLGGTWTMGLQSHATCFHDGKKVIVGGLAREIIDRLCATGAAQNPDEKIKSNPSSWYSAFDPEAMKCVLDDMIVQSGCGVLLHTFCVGAICDGAAVAGAIIENKSARQAIYAATTIDCTGDGDVAHMSGAATEKGQGGDGQCQPATTTFLLHGGDMDKGHEFIRADREAFAALQDQARARGELSPGFRVTLGAATMLEGVTYHNITHMAVDSTNAASLSQGEIEGRRQVREVVAFYRKYVPGFEKVQLINIAPHIGLRESRRIVGEYKLTTQDVLTARKFDDGIARNAYYVDVHWAKGGPDDRNSHDMRPPIGDYHEIPYGCMVPQKVENLLAAGRCISASREALGSTRVTVCCCELGEAAGVAGAMAAKAGCSVRQIDRKALRAAVLK